MLMKNQVVLAFLLTAWLVMFGVLVAFIFGTLPPMLLSPVDREVYKRRPRPDRKRLSKALEKATLVASDQQIFTGIAILVAAFCNFSSLSAYHWQTITYLGWMSSSVHLSTLTVLRSHFRKYPRVRTWRIMAMVALAILLAVALAPSLSEHWTGVASHEPPNQVGIPVSRNVYHEPLIVHHNDITAGTLFHRSWWQPRRFHGSLVSVPLHQLPMDPAATVRAK